MILLNPTGSRYGLKSLLCINDCYLSSWENQLFTYYARNMSSLSYDFFVNSEKDKIDIHVSVNYLFGIPSIKVIKDCEDWKTLISWVIANYYKIDVS